MTLWQTKLPVSVLVNSTFIFCSKLTQTGFMRTFSDDHKYIGGYGEWYPDPCSCFLKTCYVIISWPYHRSSILFRETSPGAYSVYSWSSTAGPPRQSHAGGQDLKEAGRDWAGPRMGWEKHREGCGEMWAGCREGEIGFPPFQLIFGSLHFTDRRNR